MEKLVRRNTRRKTKNITITQHLIRQISDAHKCDLQEKQIQAIKKAWFKFDRNSSGSILYSQVDDLMMGFNMTFQQRKKIQQHARQKNNFIDIQACVIVIDEVKKLMFKSFQQQNNQYSIVCQSVDAWVALGGDLEMEGVISKDKILKIINQEFQIEAGLNQLLNTVDLNQNAMNFDMFKSLFDSATQGDQQQRSRLTQSILSV